VMEVAGHLGVQLQRVEMEKALKKPGDLTAWEATMRSMAALESVTRESLVAGIAEARRAISIAPTYSLAHAALACELATLYFSFGGAKDESMACEACMHAERALMLGANDPIAMSWAALAMGFCGQWREALPYAQRSVDLNPNIANSRRNLAVFCIRLDRPDEAISHLDAAAVLAPRGSLSFLGFTYRALAHYLAGRYERALPEIRQGVLLNPGFVFSLKDKATICAKLELREEAQEAVRAIRKADPMVTMDDLHSANNASFIPPKMAAEMNATLRKVWDDTPVTA
jgi:tetratricopeptide (TPR) repeat protein